MSFTKPQVNGFHSFQVNASTCLYLTLKHACAPKQHMSEAINSSIFVLNMPIDKPQLSSIHSWSHQSRLQV